VGRAAPRRPPWRSARPFPLPWRAPGRCARTCGDDVPGDVPGDVPACVPRPRARRQGRRRPAWLRRATRRPLRVPKGPARCLGRGRHWRGRCRGRGRGPAGRAWTCRAGCVDGAEDTGRCRTRAPARRRGCTAGNVIANVTGGPSRCRHATPANVLSGTTYAPPRLPFSPRRKPVPARHLRPCDHGEGAADNRTHHRHVPIARCRGPILDDGSLRVSTAEPSRVGLRAAAMRARPCRPPGAVGVIERGRLRGRQGSACDASPASAAPTPDRRSRHPGHRSSSPEHSQSRTATEATRPLLRRRQHDHEPTEHQDDEIDHSHHLTARAREGHTLAQRCARPAARVLSTGAAVRLSAALSGGGARTGR
jgi:hypothetical protein